MTEKRKFRPKKYISILLGAALISFGMYNIHSRCAISEGGVLGMALLLQHHLHISPAISNPVMDIAAMLAGTIILKSTFLADSLFASAAFAVFYRIYECFPPLLPDLSAHPAAAAVLGGCFVGFGTILIVRHGCAAGADDSLALIANSLTRIKLSTYYFISDFSVLLLSLSYIAPAKIVWSFLTVTVSSGLIAIFCPEPEKG